jgi:hypothetical protein
MTALRATSFSPMHRVTRPAVDRYLQDDTLLRRLAPWHRGPDDEMACQRWLNDTPAKRYIANALYDDLLACEGLRIVDIGGGLTSMTRALAARHEYLLIDIMAHDGPSAIDAFLAETPPFSLRREDWHTASLPEQADVVIASDLFPNVDQRLTLFLQRMQPIAGEVRLSLTYYNEPRSYAVKRLDADEVFYILAWDGAQTARALLPFRSAIDRPDFDVFDAESDSAFANRRQVAVLRLFGRGHAGAQCP